MGSENGFLDPVLRMHRSRVQTELAGQIESELSRRVTSDPDLIYAKKDGTAEFKRYKPDWLKKERLTGIRKAIDKIRKKYERTLVIDAEIKVTVRKSQSKIKVKRPRPQPPPLHSTEHTLKLSVDWAGATKGGGTHVTREGDTVAQVARLIYGSDVYAAEIIKASDGALLAFDRKILMCAKLTLPRLFVPTVVSDFEGKRRPAPVARIPIALTYPTMAVKIGGDVPYAVLTVVQGPVILNARLYIGGNVTATRNGRITAQFTWPKYETEVKKRVAGFDYGFTFDRMGATSAKIGSTIGKLELSLKSSTSRGELVFEGQSPVFERSSGPYSIKGKIKVKIEVQMMPNPRYRPPEPAWYEKVWDYKWEALGAFAVAGLLVISAPAWTIGGVAVGTATVL
ncbi:hypothetical protein LNKW23_37330 [Paralimibaculum aggregatum]|uniref:LysM domain-containing protein n=1 Tax=Paralimibaculum aggregatum TaxID=3036245 RepID=A0ABQ6LQV5_9RHOB|nr:hypothetical protein [Limibaculum sp. NKW23]GMG84517.1 hypothetical protein LNKW23_37330 [Limibaculum sp. NKW23]